MPTKYNLNRINLCKHGKIIDSFGFCQTITVNNTIEFFINKSNEADNSKAIPFREFFEHFFACQLTLRQLKYYSQRIKKLSFGHYNLLSLNLIINSFLPITPLVI